MKIAVWHNLPSGGGKRALYDHVRGLVARGHTVEAWCPQTADREYLPLTSLIPEHVVDLTWPVPARFGDRFGLTLPTERQLAAMDEHCRTSAQQICNRDFDVIFANACQFFRTTSIGRFATIPSVLYLGEPYRWLYEALPRLPWLAASRRTQSILRPSTLKALIADFRSIRNARLQAREEVDNALAFDRILVNSHFSRESILRAYGLDADVCYLGINTDLFFNKDLVRSNTLVGLGSITREKNVRLCIEAIALLSEPRPKLIWIGNIADDRYLLEMQGLATSLQVELETKIDVPEPELVEVLNQAMAMVYAPRLEPFGLAPLEANACGVPVIAVAEGGVRETVINLVNGLVVENTQDAMAAAIRKLLANPSLARQLGAKGCDLVKSKWTVSSAVDRLEGHLLRYAGAGSKHPSPRTL